MDKGADSYRRFLAGDERAIDAVMEELFYPLVFFVNRYVQDEPAVKMHNVGKSLSVASRAEQERANVGIETKCQG